MNPAALDLPATYSAPLQSGAAAPRLGRSGAASPSFSSPINIWVGRLTPPSVVHSSDIGGGQRNTATTAFLARWNPDFCEGGRITAEGRTFDLMTILSVPGTARRTWLQLHCRHITGINPAHSPVTAFA